jgi:hypothetical protein
MTRDLQLALWPRQNPKAFRFSWSIAVTAQVASGVELRQRLPALALRRTSWVSAVRWDVGRGHGGGFCWVLLVSFGFCQFLFEDW